ncbi:hypothetical protein BAUCODRAFT_406039 [Baudoinia panamericana UAMH 10762]|uniref:Fungal N-terminal domain-containing protein n=1 Tax=Baudoinia panamericana (strain UAMH 10762) TaxID=717646 RepID=M2LTJ9_BAUPA|nr:uncharacterized protein BAUCODRAFT_406039 [Baudoinia panamericana UAMH 10762]EMC97862.1 hypothetical protein BAUCODRAFT_406039 [Baudoinia panamericana UAMH 10762]
MPAGLDEATAILAVVQAGLSLATTLKAYVDSYKDAPEDIKTLAADLESTMRYVSELKEMLDENKKAPVLNKNAVAEAEARLVQAENVVIALQNHIRKGSRQEGLGGPLKLDDLNTTKFQQAMWYFYKPGFVTVKNELHDLATRIVLFLALYGREKR